jgi:Do/DeqQ family serine protease
MVFQRLLQNLALLVLTSTVLPTAGAQIPSPELMADGQYPSLAPMIERTAPAVVNIAVKGSREVRSNPLLDDPVFKRFFGNPESRPQNRTFNSAGSGVIIDAEQGYILTNHHVIEDADEISITLLDNRTFTAEVVGSDAGTDVALIKVDAKQLSALPLGDSETLRVGDFVVAIGNPFGLSHTVTSGIVSAKGRSSINRDGYEDFIQTDASINPGNSGGALVNLRGELVGINSAILSRSGGNIGIGFAIPVAMVETIVEQLLEFGSVKRGLLGVNILSVTPDIAKDYGLKDTSGALVTSVSVGSAAEKAGIQIEDVITAVNGREVSDAGQLRATIGVLRAGDEVRIGLVRDGNKRSFKATLGTMDLPQEEVIANLGEEFDGAELVTNDASANSNGRAGVLAASVEANSPAYQRGLRSGDVIIGVNNRRIQNLQDFQSMVAASRSIILRVQRGSRGTLVRMR